MGVVCTHCHLGRTQHKSRHVIAETCTQPPRITGTNGGPLLSTDRFPDKHRVIAGGDSHVVCWQSVLVKCPHISVSVILLALQMYNVYTHSESSSYQ